jgi:hypothetical protein
MPHSHHQPICGKSRAPLAKAPTSSWSISALNSVEWPDYGLCPASSVCGSLIWAMSDTQPPSGLCRAGPPCRSPLVAEPCHTDALEFDDGKSCWGATTQLNEVTGKHSRPLWPRRVRGEFQQSDLSRSLTDHGAVHE